MSLTRHCRARTGYNPSMRTIILLAAVSAIALLSACSVMQATRVEQAVVKALAADSRTSSYKFEVSYQPGGKVLVTGEVFSAADIDAVSEIAKGVTGVTEVVNHCKVEEQSSGMIQDETVPSPFL